MSTSSNPAQHPSESIHHRIIVWLIFIACVFGFGWYKSVENARDDEALSTWNVQYKQASKEGEAEWKRITALLHSSAGRPGSQAKLEAELNGGQPFEISTKDGVAIAVWTQPIYGGEYSLGFKDGVLSQSSGHRGALPAGLVPRPQKTSASNGAESLRRAIGSTSACTWLLAFGSLFLVPRWKPLAAQLMLATSLACGMAWLVNPHYSLATNGIFSNDNLALAVIMMFLSIWALAEVAKEKWAIHRLPTTLHFGLRDLLATTAALAVALAAGPFGYVTLMVIACCLVIFALFFVGLRPAVKHQV